MDTNLITEKYILKKKYMKKRFGKLKSVVLRLIQYIYFSKKLQELINNNINDYSEKENKTYTYLYSTIDIWSHHKHLKNIIKKQLNVFAQIKPNIFKKYLIAFGNICPYIIDNKNNICGKQVNGCLCIKHWIQKTNKNICINKNLNFLPVEICNIIIKYSFEYYWKL